MNRTTVPFDWLKTIPHDLVQLDSIPLFGHAPSFPWEKLSQNLSQVFELPIQIEPASYEWRSTEKLKEGFNHPLPLNFTVAPLEGRLCWILEDTDLPFIMSTLLSKTEDVAFDGIDQDLKIGFYQFLAAEVIHHFKKLYSDRTLVPHISSENSIPQEDALCLDIKISLLNRIIWARMIIPSSFHQSWKRHYSERKLDVPLSKTLSEKLQVTLSLEAGTILLSGKEWADVHPGDFIILDDCSIEPEKEGNVVLTVNGEPLFHAVLKDGSLEIAEKPSYQKVNAHMEKKNSEEDLSEFEEHEFEDDEFEDEDTEDENTEDEDEDIEDDEDEFDDNENDEEETTLKDLLKKPKETVKEKPQTAEQPIEVKEKKTALTPEEIPVTIVIEVGRLQMSIQKLLHLQQGNFLELNVKPEDAVNLVANGKCIGKGELLRMGETLGVRILDLA